jgi:hypothetical protein
MCIWACQRCGEAYFASPPETGLCTACQQDDEQRQDAEQDHDAEEVAGDDD